MKRLRAVLGKVLSIDPATVTEATSPRDVPSWDSLNALLLVSELEETFQVRFSMEEVHSVRNVGDIRAALARHGVRLDG